MAEPPTTQFRSVHHFFEVGFVVRRGCVRLLATFLVSIFLFGCERLVLSPRQMVVKEATQAMCAARDINGMLPYVSERSRPMLNLAASMAELGSAFKGQKLADLIALQCADGGLEFVDEVKVNDTRYIVRTRTKGAADIAETVVIMESGQWKIAVNGK